MTNTLITEEVLFAAQTYDMSPNIAAAARQYGTWEVLCAQCPDNAAWVARNVPLPEDVAVLLYRLTGIRTRWRDGVLHHDTEPAVVLPNGYRAWYRRGLLDRAGGPAVIHPDGILEWHRDGLLHNDSGPAVVYPDGTALWYRRGLLIRSKVKYHRPDDLEVTL